MKQISKIGYSISATARRYPVKAILLVLCVIIMGIDMRYPKTSGLGHDWNDINTESIDVADPDCFSFAVFGDNRNSHIVFEKLLKRIDHDLQIKFAVSLGNMVSRGSDGKYRYFLRQITSTLGIPLLTTMGTRELKGGGRRLYQDIFGKAHYSFHVGNNYFLVLDDTDKEGMDLMQQDGWLTREMQTSQKYNTRLVFMNMPLRDPREGKYRQCLDSKTAEHLNQLFIKYHVTYIFSGNIHGFFQGTQEGIPYTITGGAGAKPSGNDPEHYFYHFLKVSIHDNSLNVQKADIPDPEYLWLDRLSYNCEQSLLFFRNHFLTVICLSVTGCLLISVYRSESCLRKKI